MFLHSISEQEIGRQVAGLLNDFNNLGSKRSASNICHNGVSYLVETSGKFVVGAVGLDRQGYTFTEIKHLVVHPEYRGKGIARWLVECAMKRASTKMIFATVRADNAASLSLFERVGFVRSGGYKTQDHGVVLLVRATPQWEKQKPAWRSNLSNVNTPMSTCLTSTASTNTASMLRSLAMKAGRTDQAS